VKCAEDRSLAPDLVEVEDLGEQDRAERLHRRPDGRAEFPGEREELTPCARGSTFQSSDAARAAIFGSLASIGCASPDGSPFTSATKTGTPASESWPAITRSVLVLPVPVAPATSPWRFTVDSGSRTRTSVRTSSACRGDPSVTAAGSAG
jgi:hypothetical protein